MELCQKTVLVVEDERDTRDAMCDVLQDAGYVAVGVADGQAALDYLARADGATCVILLDLMIPFGLDGWQFRSAQLADPRVASIPVVVVSAVADLKTQARGLAAAAYVAKPVNVDHLMREVERHCGAGAA